MIMTDSGLRQEVEALADRIHAMLAASENEAGSSRIVLDIPNEWLSFAAWLEMRRRMRSAGRHGPSRFSIDELSAGTIRSLARHYISSMVVSDFHLELHDLSAGSHPFLTSPSDQPRRVSADLDDGLLF